MNSEPLNEVQDLPSREDVIRFLGRQKSSIAAVYDESGAQVHLGAEGDLAEAIGQRHVLQGRAPSHRVASPPGRRAPVPRR